MVVTKDGGGCCEVGNTQQIPVGMGLREAKSKNKQ